jgi:hypothetical protein
MRHDHLFIVAVGLLLIVLTLGVIMLGRHRRKKRNRWRRYYKP